MKEKINKFGVKVGDVFALHMGYTATLIDYFQVTRIIGTCKVAYRQIGREVSHENLRYQLGWKQRPILNDFIGDENVGITKIKNGSFDTISLNHEQRTSQEMILVDASKISHWDECDSYS